MVDSGSTHDIKILNSLIETTLASVDSYEEAAKGAANPGYRRLLLKRAMRRRQVVNDLRSQVQALGGTTHDDASVLAAAGQHVFMNLSDNLAKGGDSLVNEVERGEDYIRTKYEEALEDDDISVKIRTAVVRAYAVLRT